MSKKNKKTTVIVKKEATNPIVVARCIDPSDMKPTSATMFKMSVANRVHFDHLTKYYIVSFPGKRIVYASALEYYDDYPSATAALAQQVWR